MSTRREPGERTLKTKQKHVKEREKKKKSQEGQKVV